MDPALEAEALWLQLRGLTCRLAMCYGEHSMMFTNPDVVDFMRNELGQHSAATGGAMVPIVKIPACQHHVMFDQPIALVAFLLGTIAEWERVDSKVDPRSKL